MSGAFQFMLHLLATLPEMPMAPPPEDIDIDDVWAKIKVRHPELVREDAFKIVEILIERELTGEEKTALP